MAKRTDAATRARRLVALLPLLHEGESVPIADLAHAVGATPEEIAADLTTLSMCGVPPFTPADLVGLYVDGDEVTVFMDPPALDRPLRLTLGEARALGAALEAAGFGHDDPLRMKVQDACAASVSAEELERTVRTGTSPGGIADLYALLATALDEHEKVRLSYYTGSSGRVSERVVRPWALVQRLGAWYLVAFCETAQEGRVFRLERIGAAEGTGERFEPPAEIPTAVTPDPSRSAVAEIRFAPGATLPSEAAWPGIVVEPQADGSTLAKVPYQGESWIARRVAAYLGDAVVIGPSGVRKAVRELAEALLAENA